MCFCITVHGLIENKLAISAIDDATFFLTQTEIVLHEPKKVISYRDQL